MLKINAFIPKYNVSKTGIIFDIPTKFNDDFLKDNLESDLPIINIYRCMKRKVIEETNEIKWVPANTVKITFRGQNVPDEVTFGYSKRKVKPDVPNVLQCHHCLRYGHTKKYCKQEGSSCFVCETQHGSSPKQLCSKQTKCFHCHSDQHNGTSKDCPEYLRNQLIKETMYYNNLTFSEANDQFPRTQSQFRLAEKRHEFPALPQRRGSPREEKIELSFPKKTTQELKKQYQDYIQLNQGKKPTDTTSNPGSKLYSEIAQSQTQGQRQSLMKKDSRPHPRTTSNSIKKETHGTVNGQERDKALNFIQDLGYKLGLAHTDVTQKPHIELSNDLMLIDIGRMVTEFLLSFNREVISYSSSEEDLTTTI